MSTSSGAHWLDRYATSSFAWQESRHDGHISFYRALGLVERAFDADGRHYEGRADMSIQLDVKLTTTLGQTEIRHHTLLAWTCLRARHVLLQAKAPAEHRPWMSEQQRHYFLIDVPGNTSGAIEEAKSHLVFLDEHYASVDPVSFYNAAQNCARVVDSETSLSKMLVLPQTRKDQLSYLLVVGHQIGDGIAMGAWIPDFVRLLNLSDRAIEAELDLIIPPESFRERLPLPQEALYPPITGSKARQRWFWAITRILRHVRCPLPAGFENPLLRKGRPAAADEELPWSDVLKYVRRPANSTATCRARSSRASTLRLTQICRKANVSIGAGCFALAALLMMEFYEQSEPDVPLHLRKPFITGFPLNPRPFLQGNPAANSLMLAFSDGIMLPFLPSTIDLDGRLRLLAKQAQRQLAVYQKRIKPENKQVNLDEMGSRGAGRMLAIQYIGSIERLAALDPLEKHHFDPQGAYPMRPNMTRQTCGVSSTGRGSPLASMTKYENQDFVATPLEMFAGVRAREGEFLIGVGGGDSGLSANVSVDTSAMDPDLVAAWRHRFETILEHKSVPSKL